MHCSDCECGDTNIPFKSICFCELPPIDIPSRIEEFLGRHDELYEEFLDKLRFFLHPCRLRNSLHLFLHGITGESQKDKAVEKSALCCLAPDAVTGEYSLVKLQLHGKDCLCHLEDMLRRNVTVQHLEVSGCKPYTLPALLNLIRLPKLRYLDTPNNGLHKIVNFETPPEFLTRICYAHNAVNCIRDLTPFWSLVVLDLSHNKIHSITGLQGLRYLKHLDLSYNQIESADGLSGLPLTWLDLSYNRISCGNLALLHLRTLHMVHNRLESLCSLEGCPSLRKVCVRDNEVDCIGITKQLWWLRSLDLRGNYVCVCPDYRRLVMSAMPALSELDGKHIYPEEYVTLMLEERPTEHMSLTRKLLARHATALRLRLQHEHREEGNFAHGEKIEAPSTFGCSCSVDMEAGDSVPESLPREVQPLHVQYADHDVIRGRLCCIQRDIAPCRAFR